MRPRTLREYGTSTIATVAMNWARSWSREGRPIAQALLLHGKPGTGKTTLARVLAHEMRWPCLELNASQDFRKDDYHRLMDAAASRALVGNHKLIILDEADNLTKLQQKRMAQVISDTHHPVVVIANDIRTIAKHIRRSCLELEVPLPDAFAKRALAERVAYIAGTTYDDDDVQAASTFREVVAVVESGNTVSNLHIEDGFDERLRRSLSGESWEVRPSEFWQVAAWISDNTDGEEVADWDLYLSRYRETGKNMEKYLAVAARVGVDAPSWPWSIGVRGKERSRGEGPQNASQATTTDNSPGVVDAFL